MSRFAFLFLFLTLFSSAAKSKTTHHYKGHILVAGKKISFEIDYTIQSNNLIMGTSLTAKGTSDETRCRIKGKYNRKNKSIYFYETVVLSSKAKFENLNFCLLTANLKLKETTDYQTYSGALTGYIRGTKKKCATGTMYIQRKKVKKISPPKAQPARDKAVVLDKLFSDLKAKKTIAYTVEEQKVKLSIWDDANEDGDRVSIYLNGKLVLSNYELKSSKKELTLSLNNAAKNYIKIKALNEGKATPNTSRIQLTGKALDKNVQAHIKTNEAVYITLQQTK